MVAAHLFDSGLGSRRRKDALELFACVGRTKLACVGRTKRESPGSRQETEPENQRRRRPATALSVRTAARFEDHLLVVEAASHRETAGQSQEDDSASCESER
jgi:hypothetical protein